MVILRHSTVWIPIVICLLWFVKLKNLSVLVQNVRFERNRYLTERKSCFALDVFAWCWPLSIVRSSSCSDVWTVQNDQKLMAFVLEEPLPRIVKVSSHNVFVIFSGHETGVQKRLFRFVNLKKMIDKQNNVQNFFDCLCWIKIFFWIWPFERDSGWSV